MVLDDVLSQRPDVRQRRLLCLLEVRQHRRRRKDRRVVVGEAEQGEEGEADDGGDEDREAEEQLTDTLRRALADTEPGLPVYDIVPLEVRMNRGISNDRLIARLTPTGRESVRLPWSAPHPIPEALRAIANRCTDQSGVCYMGDPRRVDMTFRASVDLGMDAV